VAEVRARFPAGSPQGGPRCQAAWQAMNERVFAFIDESQRRRYEAMLREIQAVAKARQALASSGESLGPQGEAFRPMEAMGRGGRRTRAS